MAGGQLVQGWLEVCARGNLLSSHAQASHSTVTQLLSPLRCCACVLQADQIRNSGIHMVVATPGRLKDMLT